MRRPTTTVDSDIYLYNTATKELKHLTPHTGDVSFAPQTFDPDSKYLYYTTDEGGEFQYVKRYDLATGKSEMVREGAVGRVVHLLLAQRQVSRHRRQRRRAHRHQNLRHEDQQAQSASRRLSEGDITGVQFSPSETRMAFYLNGDRSPANLYVYDFATKKVTKLTDSLNPEIDPADLVEAQNIRYKSFDGMEIPAILYKPHEASAQSKVPAIVLVHGGPGGQARRGYKAQVQFLVNHGYAVLDVNNRGSSGYGKTFFAADDGKHGREPLWDVIEAKKYLESHGLRRREEDRHHGRLLRRLHGAGGARLQARGVRRRR